MQLLAPHEIVWTVATTTECSALLSLDMMYVYKEWGSEDGSNINSTVTKGSVLCFSWIVVRLIV